MSGTFSVILVACISAFAVIVTLVYAALDRGKRGREEERVRERQENRERERAELETVIRHYKLFSSAEFREQVAAEIAAQKRQLREQESDSGERDEGLEQQIAEREAELKAANRIIAARSQELEDAIKAAGVVGTAAEAIRRAAQVDSLLPLLGDALRQQRAEAEAMAVRVQQAETLKQRLAEIEAETVKLQMAEDQARKEREAQAEALTRQLAEAEEMKQQLERLETDAKKLREAKEAALERQREEAEAMRAQLAEAEAMQQEMAELNALQAFRETLAADGDDQRRLHRPGRSPGRLFLVAARIVPCNIAFAGGSRWEGPREARRAELGPSCTRRADFARLAQTWHLRARQTRSGGLYHADAVARPNPLLRKRGPEVNCSGRCCQLL